MESRDGASPYTFVSLSCVGVTHNHASSNHFLSNTYDKVGGKYTLIVFSFGCSMVVNEEAGSSSTLGARAIVRMSFIVLGQTGLSKFKTLPVKQSQTPPMFYKENGAWLILVVISFSWLHADLILMAGVRFSWSVAVAGGTDDGEHLSFKLAAMIR